MTQKKNLKWGLGGWALNLKRGKRKSDSRKKTWELGIFDELTRGGGPEGQIRTVNKVFKS